ncbi:MAG: twin-arginine translocase TatA/TatE family subunit [OCS116 cluster bacterium]|uniref:Sec-independent protein translocase protein TatA n=1 Tax=OCS116 cluster bacterium TaxID=2030921 RepID=A0A2A4Z3X6_9PROT|nr:twin-arginine translocase TatA/TatE family subunit [OCS116 cluster bacterium]
MPGWTQILIVIVLAFLLFGRGKISDVMGDFAKGIKSFKKGMAEEETPSADDAKIIDHDTVSEKVAETAETVKEATK